MTVFEVVMNWEQSGEVAKNVLHYQDTDVGNIDWQDFCDEIKAAMDTPYRDTISSSVEWVGITVREDSPGSVGVTYVPTGGGVAGTATDDSYVHSVAALVRKKANSTQRPNLGRIYQCGVSVEELDDTGFFGTGARSNIASFWSDMLQITPDTGGTLSMVIKASNPTAPNTVAYNEVDEVAMLLNPATQRRRRVVQ